jgi:hypothetical protein
MIMASQASCSITKQTVVFTSRPVRSLSKPFHPVTTETEVSENRCFEYPLFIPSGPKASKACIILLHGLNEPSWEKYLSWAETLAAGTGKTVLLFPIAYHINRAPSWWRDPRAAGSLLIERRSEAGENSALSFANVALSRRLSQDPSRFYQSGRQTIADLVALARQVKGGAHPFLDAGATLDFFGYSIGSFLAEVLLMANPGRLFNRSKLFVFCGGSIFKAMYGASKYIMDKVAYDRLFHYYCQEWLEKTSEFTSGRSMESRILRAFNAMILPDAFQEERLSFFKTRQWAIAGISLKKDRVMPYAGVQACMGESVATACFEQLDFPFDYSHESPFPAPGRVDKGVLAASFSRVFGKATGFLA